MDHRTSLDPFLVNCKWEISVQFQALPFLGARVVVFTVTRNVSEAEEPSRRDFLAHASGYCAPRNGRAQFQDTLKYGVAGLK